MNPQAVVWIRRNEASEEFKDTPECGVWVDTDGEWAIVITASALPFEGESRETFWYDRDDRLQMLTQENAIRVPLGDIRIVKPDAAIKDRLWWGVEEVRQANKAKPRPRRKKAAA